MRVNLIIDIGNTLTKLALYAGGNMTQLWSLEEVTVEWLKDALAGYDCQQSIVSSTKHLPSWIEWLRSYLPCVEILHADMRLPFVVGYDDPSTIGQDRVAAMAGACSLKPDGAFLVIDIGTCVTYDYVDATRHHHGGSISPGLSMRFDALHEHTDRLPLVANKDEVERFGTNTAAAIRSGVVAGLTYELEGYIASMKANVPGLLVFLAGGDGYYFAERLKYSTFVDPYLVMRGLDYILKYNAK